ncbi:8-amino-7-oxononanoate synthase [Limnohabitans sp.]|uniref:8-amino-7-oxononanoate synthase n=1 Tax=Limnohabitans sp. TaxID=1907725 RepID=UPI00286F53D1|nr:8-amino-7-oxononanoate synthase [Limnohabitans sp.]
MTHALFQTLSAKLADIDTQNLRRKRLTTETPCQPHLVVRAQPILAFNSNDYLGLAAHPQVVEAFKEGASLYGVGSGASHLISGHSQAHARLEEKLAAMLSPYLESARALYFCTGYMANLGILSALADSAQGDITVFSESLNHASLIDGIRLSRSAIALYPHCDTQALGEALTACTSNTKVVVTDSVFSMDGDIAPVRELLALCEQHDAWLVVDDAHGFGVLGETGCGILAQLQLRSHRLIYMGTLGKAAGVGGAFVAAHDTFIDWMVQRSRPYIYTTAAPPALAHALLTSLRIILSEEGQARRAHLQELIQQLATSPIPANWSRLPSSTAIQPIVIGSNADVLKASAALQAQGLWVTAIRAPTVPAGTARLRITLSAAHTTADVAQLIHALRSLA